MKMKHSRDTSQDYLAAPPSARREGVPPLRRHHWILSWRVQTPIPQYYYASTVDMYGEFSDEGHRLQHIINSPPQLANSSLHLSSIITPKMARTMPRAIPPSPLTTPPDVLLQDLMNSYPECLRVSQDVETIGRHVVVYYQSPKQVPPPSPSLVMDDNGVASVRFNKLESPSSSYLQENAFDDDKDEEEEEMSAIDLSDPPLYPMTFSYGMTQSNSMPSSTTRTYSNVPRFHHSYGATAVPVTLSSYSQQIRNQHSHTYSLSDPSSAASSLLYYQRNSHNTIPL